MSAPPANAGSTSAADLTLTNNCTSNVVDHVNRVAPGTVPASWKTVLPGYTDDVALRLGLIDTRLGLDAARERFRINDAARRYVGAREFSLRIRDGRQATGG